MAFSPYILVYIDPLLTYRLDPFGLCAIYFDLNLATLRSPAKSWTFSGLNVKSY